MSTICQKCLVGRGQEAGEACSTPGCDGVVEVAPEYKDLVDELPEPMTCGRRFDVYVGGVPVHTDREERQDHWDKFKSNGDRVCSYCGSLHPDDMFELVRKCADAPEDAPYMSVTEIEPSDKAYKIYVKQPGVRNAHEGGIKFYTQHLPRGDDGKVNIPQERNDELKRAVRATKIRFDRYLKTAFPRPA